MHARHSTPAPSALPGHMPPPPLPGNASGRAGNENRLSAGGGTRLQAEGDAKRQRVDVHVPAAAVPPNQATGMDVDDDDDVVLDDDMMM